MSLSRIDDFYEKVIDAVLKELCAALLESDVNVKLVSQLRTKVKAKVGLQFRATSSILKSGLEGQEES